MQIIQIHASKVRDVRESGFWKEPDEDGTEITRVYPWCSHLAEMWRDLRKRHVTPIKMSNRNVL
jgi:hypothetical protein